MSKFRLNVALKSLLINDIKDIHVSKELLNSLPKKLDDSDSILNSKNKYKTSYSKLNKNDPSYKLHNEFTEIYNNSFIGQETIDDVITNCNHLHHYKSNKRDIKLMSSDNKSIKKYINKIDSILNMFDLLTKKENKYKIKIYMSNLKKNLDFMKSNNGHKHKRVIDSASINTGSTYPSVNITLWRKEELCKVLIHELVHYLLLDIYEHQDDIKHIYKDVNLDVEFLNPNEAYTEYMAIILYIYWIYQTTSCDLSLYSFIKKRLLIELGWSFYQIAKIIKYFKCYGSYLDLFTNKCEFRQRTSVLSYFILKTYYLFYSDRFMSCINFSNSSKIRFTCVKDIDLKDEKFAKNIDRILQSNDKINFNKYWERDSCMRMSCLD